MTLEIRKRLQPLDTNSININENFNPISNNSTIRRTRSRIHAIHPVDRTIIKDENLCRLQVNITKDFIYDESNHVDGRGGLSANNNNNNNISQKLSEDLITKPLRFNFRKRCVSTETSSTESIPDCKSISNADSSTELNTIVRESAASVAARDRASPRDHQKEWTTGAPHIVNKCHRKSMVIIDHCADRSAISNGDNGAYFTSRIYYTPSFKRIKPRTISVNVPRWRSIKSCGNFRRTRNSLLASQIENLSEEAFLERHIKYELEERRVEEALQRSLISSNRQLQHKKSFEAQNYVVLNNHHSKKWQNVVPKTFVTKHDLNYCTISVKDDLPVTVFGVTLPILKSRQFQFDR